MLLAPYDRDSITFSQFIRRDSITISTLLDVIQSLLAPNDCDSITISTLLDVIQALLAPYDCDSITFLQFNHYQYLTTVVPSQFIRLTNYDSGHQYVSSD